MKLCILVGVHQYSTSVFQVDNIDIYVCVCVCVCVCVSIYVCMYIYIKQNISYFSYLAVYHYITTWAIIALTCVICLAMSYIDTSSSKGTFSKSYWIVLFFCFVIWNLLSFQYLWYCKLFCRTGEIMQIWVKVWQATPRMVVTCFWSAGLELSWHNT
jgi:hypothetical protein